MPTCFILIGLPGVGKSTFRKSLVEAYPMIGQVSSDDYIEYVAAMQMKTYRDVFAETIKAAEQDANRALRAALSTNNSIVVDRTNMSKKSRAKSLNLIPDHYEKVAIWIPTPDPVEHARRLNRPGKDIPEHVMKSMAASFEQPTIEEGFQFVIQTDNPQHFWDTYNFFRNNKEMLNLK